MKNLNLALALLMIGWSSTVFAIAGGTGVSDGGHGIACRERGQTTVRFLDAAESEAQSGVDSAELVRAIDFKRGGFFDRFQAVSVVIEGRAIGALGAHHPFVKTLHDEMRKLAASFPLGFTSPDAFTGFKDTYDYGHLAVELKPGCGIVQLAVRTREFAATKVIMNPQYWPLLSEFDKYELMVHEASHAWFAPEVSTRAVRQATAYLFSSEDFRAAHREAFRALIERKEAASR